MIVTLSYILAPLIILLAALTFIATNTKTIFYRYVAMLLFVVMIGILPISITELLSNPKPHELSFMKGGDVELLDSYIIYEEKIYVWVLEIGKKKPSYYVFGWDIELAQEIKDLMEKKKEKGSGQIIIKKFFDYDKGYSKDRFEFNYTPPQRQHLKPYEAPKEETPTGPQA